MKMNAETQRGQAATKKLNGLNELQRLHGAKRICAGCANPHR